METDTICFFLQFSIFVKEPQQSWMEIVVKMTLISLFKNVYNQRVSTSFFLRYY